MAFDTPAYAKHLEAGGFTREQAEAEAHSEVPNRFVRPDLAIKADLAAVEQRIIAAMQQLEARLDARIEARIHQAELRMVGVMAAMLGLCSRC